MNNFIRYSIWIHLVLWTASVINAQPFTKSQYIKEVYDIPMRDGIKLHTIVYKPNVKEKQFPILMKRTCYGIAPYAKNRIPNSLGPSKYLMESGYIFVYQDVRGRYMSEGTFDNMRPNLKGNDPELSNKVDESSDTYDTIDWLLKNLKGHNSKVGQWGISYPGFYTAAALPEAHPALVASSPQAPIADFFFDDFHHMGAFLLSYLRAFPVFGHQKNEKTTQSWYRWGWDKLSALGLDEKNAYQYHLDLGPVSKINELYDSNFFWNQMVKHPNYDDFWKARNILPHLEGIDHAVMTVGGWFDAEDLYGPLNIYKKIEKDNPKAKNTLVMGPWSHGDWARTSAKQFVNHIYFGEHISAFYQQQIEYPFFEHHLKGTEDPQLPEAYLFDTGIKSWKKFMSWPPQSKQMTLSFLENNELAVDQPVDESLSFRYQSDPMDPVPFRSEIVAVGFTPRKFMTDDQRHASKRKDVLTFTTSALEEDMELAGEILADLHVSISSTDADFIVKLIDVYPDDIERPEGTPSNIELGAYQQLVRHEVFRGRFRNSFSEPEPFVPGKIEQIKFPLQDILHTFKKGHRIMIQIHSTWFPYIDRNPQNYVENIYLSKLSDYTKNEVTLYGKSSIKIGGNYKFQPK